MSVGYSILHKKKRSDMRRFQRGWSWLGSVMRTCIIAFVESYYQREGARMAFPDAILTEGR